MYLCHVRFVIVNISFCKFSADFDGPVEEGGSGQLACAASYASVGLTVIVLGLYRFFSGARYASVTVIVLGLSLSLGLAA